MATKTTIVKHATNGRLYEVVVHPGPGMVYACHQLSAFDGMPMGQTAYIHMREFTDGDQQRLDIMRANG